MDVKKYLTQQCAVVEQALARYMLPEEGVLANHIQAMRYSLFAGGKRIRPILALAAAEALHAATAPLLPVACALECIHTYSLIHDDLPAMDDDDLRRGKPTCHVVFGEAAAILAGDGLLSFAFELLSHPDALQGISPQAQLTMINTIAKAIGPVGMVGGQSLDLAAEGQAIDFEHLRLIHGYKTGALITASVQAGAIFGKGDENQFAALSRYGAQIGLAFQIVDDLLDVEGTTADLGKTAGADAQRNKATYPAFFGVAKTKVMAKEAVDAAVTALEIFDAKAEPLRAIARYIYERNN
ncbi:MAG: polyprenyl synthetase family protein [Deltaproteobacteria bacterium]|jgi:geranylgeranyl diphosphate synthase type II|uniref:polyprenyl synthetase family protein n=1 Tax=Hydrosulfovibrio ferrireducens TaxID=2934181 RepID=UPI001209958B|nr:MAG: polyprenyl synthetase family protein [Deltaproteobacteria bacterium]